MSEEKEFSHIEIRLVRNPKWLEPYEKRGIFLSEEFPIGELWLPSRFWDMTEDDIDEFKKWLLPKCFHMLEPKDPDVYVQSSTLKEAEPPSEGTAK